MPFRDGPVRLPDRSDHIGNLSIGYEKGGLSTRLAANYRGTFFDGAEDPDDPPQDCFHDAELRVDFQAEYSLTPNFVLLPNVNNITNEPFYAYLGDKDFSAQSTSSAEPSTLGSAPGFSAGSSVRAG